MTILLVEDDDNKRHNVESWLRTIDDVEIRLARSVQSALRSVLADPVDLMLLDMTLPTFDITLEEHGGRPQAFGGREVLRQLERRGIRIPVVVLTQFERFGVGNDAVNLSELDEQLRVAHPDNYVGAIHYDPAVYGWKFALGELIRDVKDAHADLDS